MSSSFPNPPCPRMNKHLFQNAEKCMPKCRKQDQQIQYK